MANPSYTYTLTNGTTADATQVQQNFTDILNGVTDGTKDLSVSAFTAAGTATLNGSVAVGNSSSDDLTVTASLASSIPIKTNNTYDIGTSALTLRALYLNTLYVRDTSAAYDVPIVFTSSTALTASRQLTIDMVNAARTVKIRSNLDFSNSIVRVHTGNGHGSTNTKIRRFTTAETNSGSAITYADSAANGATFTINTTGLYFIAYYDKFDGGTQFNVGISKNSSQLTTDIESITVTDRLLYTNAATNVFTGGSVMAFLTATDIIRAHTDGDPNNSDNRTIFVIAHIY